MDHRSQWEESDTAVVQWVPIWWSHQPRRSLTEKLNGPSFRVSEALHNASFSLDDDNVETEFRRRANLMRSPAKF